MCLQTLTLPALNGIPMRSNATDAQFVPDFFVRAHPPPTPRERHPTPPHHPTWLQGHAGRCSGNCKMSMNLFWDGMEGEFAYMPNGELSMQWFAFWSNATGRRLGANAARMPAQPPERTGRAADTPRGRGC